VHWAVVESTRAGRVGARRRAGGSPPRPEPPACHTQQARKAHDEAAHLHRKAAAEHHRQDAHRHDKVGDAAESAWFSAQALADPRVESTALQRAQQLVEVHRQSKNRNRNLLALADLYAELSRRYAQASRRRRSASIPRPSTSTPTGRPASTRSSRSRTAPSRS
jgi:hypothetical protein